jgi:hypothetical protein
MTLASAFAFLLCSQRVRPPLSFHKTSAQTYDGVPMTVLDQPLVDKIHTPPANLSRLAVRWVIVITPFRNTHFSQMYSFRMATPNPLTAGCSQVSIPRTYASFSLPRDMAKITARHTTCDHRV